MKGSSRQNDQRGGSEKRPRSNQSGRQEPPSAKKNTRSCNAPSNPAKVKEEAEKQLRLDLNNLTGFVAQGLVLTEALPSATSLSRAAVGLDIEEVMQPAVELVTSGPSFAQTNSGGMFGGLGSCPTGSNFGEDGAGSSRDTSKGAVTKVKPDYPERKQDSPLAPEDHREEGLVLPLEDLSLNDSQMCTLFVLIQDLLEFVDRT